MIGSLTIPLAIGTVGGSINSRTDVKQSYRLLGQDITSSELANVIAGVGLANNLAALLAISTTGIQAGHMKLQAKNTVANLTATSREKEQVRQMMIDKKEYSLAAAEQFLRQIREGQ